MRPLSRSLLWVVCGAVLVLAGLAAAQIPQQMNYQVMLTDDADQPLADQSVQLVFRIYNVESGGGSLWNETHNVTTNSIGVASVVVGSTNPIHLLFNVPLWLQVEVDGEVMTPRRPLAAAPYARRADEADHAVDSDHAVSADELDGIPASAWALDDDLWQPGSLNNPANPLEWTKLKSVPAGFADGVDDAGEGDGHSLDSATGGLIDVVYVNDWGIVQVGGDANFTAKFEVNAPTNCTAGHFQSSSQHSDTPAVRALCDSSTAVLAYAGSISSYWSSGTPAAFMGFAARNGTGGRFVATGDGDGVICASWGSGAALRAEAEGDGSSGYFSGGHGIWAELESGYPVMEIENREPSGFADGLWLSSQSGANSATWLLNSNCYEGRAGRFTKLTDDDVYAVTIAGASSTAEGLYVTGTIFSTALMAHGVETSRGTEAIFGVSSPDAEIVTRGQGRLSGGAARVEFDRLFAETISGPSGLTVTATPVGAWSALYVERIDGGGFDLRSDAGDRNVEFHWVAVGRSKDHERRPEITIPDPVEEERIARAKEEEVISRHPEKRDESPAVLIER